MLTIHDGDEIHVMEESILQIRMALKYYKKELERQRIKSAKRYIPTGNQIGRPKKNKIDEVKIDNIILNQD